MNPTGWLGAPGCFWPWTIGAHSPVCLKCFGALLLRGRAWKCLWKPYLFSALVAFAWIWRSCCSTIASWLIHRGHGHGQDVRDSLTCVGNVPLEYLFAWRFRMWCRPELVRFLVPASKGHASYIGIFAIFSLTFAKKSPLLRSSWDVDLPFLGELLHTVWWRGRKLVLPRVRKIFSHLVA